MALMTILAAAALAGPPAPVQPSGATTTPPVRKAEEGCAFSRESVEKGEIVVCAPRPETYRLNPDVMAAKKAMRSGGAPKGPERFKDDSCRTVGPRGCADAGINLLAAALTAAKMADKLSKGESVKGMFVTDPHPTEYQLYLQAKREREAKEEQAETAAAVKKASGAKTEVAR